MSAIDRRHPRVAFEIFTTVPRWFFQDSLRVSYRYHRLVTDVGLVQETSLRENLPATIRKLRDFLPFEPALVRRLARWLTRLRCRLVLCDISPLGIAAAHAAGLPSVLVENFTWDWIYGGYFTIDARIKRYADLLREYFNCADYRIQTEPVCLPRRSAELVVGPVSRRIRKSAREVRRRLGLPRTRRAVLITMGGVAGRGELPQPPAESGNVSFIIPGAASRLRVVGNHILLPHRSEFYHPDLVNACDAVIGKLGYSTLAEVFQAGVPYGAVLRRQFREARVLRAFLRERMAGIELTEGQWRSGRRLSRLPELLAQPRRRRRLRSGAEDVANFALKLLPRPRGQRGGPLL